MAVGVARQGFDIDLRHGQAREEALVHTLLGSRVEAKSDGKCRLSGNLFIEYRYRGQPSGIATTTAARWAFEYDDDAWLIVPTERLRQAARRALREERTVVGGDHNLSMGGCSSRSDGRWLVRHPDDEREQLALQGGL